MQVYLMIRVAPSPQDSLVKRGDVISIRPATEKVTEFEKKRLLILKVEVDEEKLALWNTLVRLQSTMKPLPVDDKLSDEEKREALIAFESERLQKPPYGLFIEIDGISLGLSSNFKEKLEDPEQIVEPMDADHTVVFSRG